MSAEPFHTWKYSVRSMGYNVFYAELVAPRGRPGSSQSYLGFRVSLRRTSKHRYSLLQPGYLCEPWSATRRPVCMDAVDKDLPIRRPDARRSVAPRPRRCAILLHRFNPARHRLAWYLYNDARNLTLTFC